MNVVTRMGKYLAKLNCLKINYRSCDIYHLTVGNLRTINKSGHNLRRGDPMSQANELRFSSVTVTV